MPQYKKDISSLKEEYIILWITKFIKKYKVSAKRVYEELGYLTEEQNKEFKRRKSVRKINEPLLHKHNPDTVIAPEYKGRFKEFMNRF